MYTSLIIKFLFIFFLIFTVEPPINNLINLSFIIIGIGIVLFTEIKPLREIKISNLIIIFVIFVITFTINKKDIDEAHSTFFSEIDINTISEFLPTNIILDLKEKYKENFDFERALKSHDANHFSSIKKFKNYMFIKESYAFSVENFFHKSDYTRKINSINFDSREKLKIDEINSLKYNLVFDKHFRREIPYYILYKIPNRYRNSTICSSGDLYFGYDVKNINLNNVNFKKNLDECIKLKNNYEYFYLIGFSINKKNNLSIKLYKNYFQLSIQYIKYLLISLFISICFITFFCAKLMDKKDYYVVVLSIISSIIFVYLKDINLLSGLRYFRGGGDGLFHEHMGNQIVKNLYNKEWLNAFRAGNNIFYFMPGLRYFIAFSKIIFGSTSYGYLIICLTLPYSLFKLLSNLLPKKISFYLIISFLLVPIFENMGFGFFNYIGQITRNHAETLAITLLIYCLAKISYKNYFKDVNYLNLLTISFFLAFSTILRPNFLPTSLLIFIYILFNINKNQFHHYIFSCLGYSSILFCLFHNYYFGDKLIIFTDSKVHFIYNEAFQNLNFSNLKSNFYINQIIKWNPLYNIHRVVILIFIIYSFLKYKNSQFIKLLFVSMITQHIVLLVTHPDSRYAYLAWLLTFILFVYYFFKRYLIFKND